MFPLHPRRARIVAVALVVYEWVVDRIRFRQLTKGACDE